eukprot:5664694-Amphidinium_carterae.1
MLCTLTAACYVPDYSIHSVLAVDSQAGTCDTDCPRTGQGLDLCLRPLPLPLARGFGLLWMYRRGCPRSGRGGPCRAGALEEESFFTLDPSSLTGTTPPG